MEFITQNGRKKVEIKEASFKDASNLKKAVMKNILAVSQQNGIPDINGLDITKLLDLATQIIINADTSDEFGNAVFACLNGWIYDGFFKINMQLFDDKPEIREDYYEIVVKCVEVTLRPFFKSLCSELKSRMAQMEKTKDLISI